MRPSSFLLVPSSLLLVLSSFLLLLSSLLLVLSSLLLVLSNRLLVLSSLLLVLSNRLLVLSQPFIGTVESGVQLFLPVGQRGHSIGERIYAIAQCRHGVNYLFLVFRETLNRRRIVVG